HDKIILNFNRVVQIRPTALLLLLAELHRYQLTLSVQRVTGLYPKDPKVERMLQDSGFFRLIKVDHRIGAAPKQFPLDYIEFITDVRAEGEQVLLLRNKLFGDRILMPDIARRNLFRSLTEAMTNVCQHAYPKEDFAAHPARNRWWLAGHVNRLRGDVTITFCDLGVGIPRTLPKLYASEVIRAVLALLPGVKPNDGEMIKAGMELGRSATKQSNRGKGLNDLRKFIDAAAAGSLHIVSGRGKYRYGAGGVESISNHRISVGGTLLKWTVPMARVTGWKGDQGDDDERNVSATQAT
ncbi:MAG: hypothetical protein ACREO5_14280, partial [Candidatus Binatia bacterium]